VQVAAAPSPLNVYPVIVVAAPAVPAKMPLPAKTLQPLEKLTVVGELMEESPVALADPPAKEILSAYACWLNSAQLIAAAPSNAKIPFFMVVILYLGLFFPAASTAIKFL
jgi:hypothetical protein